MNAFGVTKLSQGSIIAFDSLTNIAAFSIHERVCPNPNVIGSSVLRYLVGSF